MSETVRQRDINDEMRESYLNYAMSVIVSRALPDARDGLKPVQRRILYAMHDMGLRSDRPFKKSARVVGEVLGKYHPHGDQTVYEAMVRMAQDFSLRYPLVDGQGNFGSIDGDSAAAMRYTETRMAEVGSDMLIDLDKRTVDFTTNFDDTLSEPDVLPAIVPSLLVNGSTGIAVGMSTSIPPHNLGEVVDALTYMLNNWSKVDDITASDLMEFVKGPDFPTGGVVFRRRDDTDMLLKAYSSGRGRVSVRATATIEQIGRSKSRIIVTEIPYQVNKTNLMSKIADLHREGKLEGLTDLRDESDRNGLRVVIETTRNVDAEDVLRQLYKYTPMEQTFSLIMLALVNGEPKVLTLKQALRIYLDHRLEVVRRRSEYELERARQRAHIVEGLLKALDNLDEVIDTIRRSRTTETAHANLVRKFSLSDDQATAILNMQLRRLAALERRKLQEEHKELRKEVTRLEGLLRSGVKMRKVVGEELEAVRAKYADPRRTVIVNDVKSNIVTATDLVQNQRVWVSVAEDGTVGRTSDATCLDIPARPNKLPYLLHQANTKDIMYLIAANGEAVSRYVYELPELKSLEGGIHWTEGTEFARAAHLAALVAIPEEMVGEEAGFLTLATVGGTVKRVRIADLPPVTDQAFTIMRVDDGDSLGWARWTSGRHEILLATAFGQLIRFDEEDVRPMTLRAGGVAGIKLKSEADGVVSMEVITPAEALEKRKVALVWTITDNGLAKATKVANYPKQKRYGQGVVNLKLTKESEEIVGMLVGDASTELYIKTKRNKVKQSKIGRSEVGRRSITPKPFPGLRLGKTDRVVGVLSTTRAVEERAAEQLPLI